MATCVEDFGASGASTVGAGSGAAGGEGIPEKARATYQTSKAATVANTSERAKRGGFAASLIVRDQATPPGAGVAIIGNRLDASALRKMRRA